MGCWDESEFNKVQQQREILCLMAKDKVRTLNYVTKANLINQLKEKVDSLGKKLEEKDHIIENLRNDNNEWAEKVEIMYHILERLKEDINEMDAAIKDLTKENRGWKDKVSRLLSQEAEVPRKDVVPTLEAKIEKLTLENYALNSNLLTFSLELKGLQINEKEKHDK